MQGKEINFVSSQEEMVALNQRQGEEFPVPMESKQLHVVQATSKELSQPVPPMKGDGRKPGGLQSERFTVGNVTLDCFNNISPTGRSAFPEFTKFRRRPSTKVFLSLVHSVHILEPDVYNT